MADKKIEWCDKSWNPVVGCTKCSPGCLNCYAEKFAARLGNMMKPGYCDDIVEFAETKDLYLPKWTGEINMLPGQLDKPLHWRKPRRIFVCSMSDLFHPKVPFEFILKIIGVTIAAPWHTFLILTKRPDRMLKFFACWPDGWFIREGMKHSTFSNEFFAIDSIKDLLTEKILKKANDYWLSNYDQSKRGKLDGPVPFPQPNLHLGVSISNQAEADEKIPILLQIPAAVRWLSIEPMLGPIDLRCVIVGPRRRCVFDCLRGCAYYERGVIYDRICGHVNWVVVGCESLPGKKAGRFQDGFIEAARNLVGQCQAANVPIYVKQLPINGKVSRNPEEWPIYLRIQQIRK